MYTELILNKIDPNKLTFIPKYDKAKAKDYILLSRVNQALCDEAEAGRIHGIGNLLDGDWIDNSMAKRIRLNCPNYLQQSTPMIETMYSGMPQALPFVHLPYLQMATNGLSSTIFDYQNLLTHAKELGNKFKINGQWGSKNRINDHSNWTQNLSTFNHKYQVNNSFIVNGYNGLPQYCCTILNNMILPITLFQRENFPENRYLLFPPEKNIAIYFKNLPSKSTSHIVLTNNYNLRNYYDSQYTTSIGCFLGDNDSISAHDFSCLNNRKVTILIGNRIFNNFDDIDFAIKLASELRKRKIHFDINFINCENNFTAEIMTLEELCKLAQYLEIFIPNELYENFGGNLTLSLGNYKSMPIIDKLINNDDTIKLNISSKIPAFLVESYLINELKQHEQNIPIAIFMNNDSQRLACKYLPKGISAFDYQFLNTSDSAIAIRDFKYNIQDAKVVFFTDSSVAQKKPVFDDILTYCVKNKIAVIISNIDSKDIKENKFITNSINIEKLNFSNSNHHLSLTCQNSDYNKKIVFDKKWDFIKTDRLTLAEKEQNHPSIGNPSRPFKNNFSPMDSILTAENIFFPL